MTRAIPLSPAFAIAFAGALLGACGNASEKVTIGSWDRAGEPGAAHEEDPEIQAFRRRALQISALSIGDGPRVQAGDLVRVDMHLTENQGGGRTEPLPRQQLWLWTGNEGPASVWGDERGRMGTPYLRASLVGQRLGTVLQVEPREGAQVGATVTVPLHVIGTGAEFTIVGPDHGSSGGITAQLTLVEACPATLYRRTTVIDQWGWVFSPGSDYPNTRRGELYWGGIKADCPGRAPLWFMTGPNAGAGMKGGNAYNGYYSYQAKHPASRYPDDWPAPGAGAALPAELKADPKAQDEPARAVPPSRSASSRAEIERKIQDIDSGERAPGR
jgi:hypothetical protein